MKRYADSIRAELVKQFTTRAWWVLALVMFLYIAFTAGLVGGLTNTLVVGTDAVDQFGQLNVALPIYALGPTVGYLFPVLVGALAVTSEYRHHTIGQSFIWNGSRTAVLWGKTTVQFFTGVLYGAIALVAAVLASAFFLMASGVPTALGDGETWLVFLRALGAMGLWAVIGVGIGVLLRSQAAAIVIVLVFTQFIEPMARMLGVFSTATAKIVSYLPGAASDAFTGASFYTMITDGGTYAPLPWWGGGLVLLGYAVVLLLAGWLLRWRSDVN